MDVCELPEVGGTQQQREANGDRSVSIVDAASEIHIASRIPNQTSHTLWKTRAQWASLGWFAEMCQSGSSSCTGNAVFTEQGSSASQMTAAKVMDIISRLPGCAGQAADAVSAYTQVKMEDAPKLLKIPTSECPDIWIRLPRHKWPKSWSSMEDPVVPLESEICTGIL